MARDWGSNPHNGTKMKINFELCECGSIYAPVYWSEEKQKFVCKLCVGYPDDSEMYKK